MSDNRVESNVIERSLESISSIVSTVAFLGMIWMAVHVASNATGAKDVYRYVISHFSNFVDPQIDAAVQQESGGRFIYEYTVGNKMLGFQEIRHFTIVTDGGVVYGPSGVWNPMRVPVMGSHYGLSWVFSPDDGSRAGIARGEARSGFRIISGGLPTIVKAHAGHKLDYLPYVGLLANMTTPAGKRVTRWTIGPVFRRSPRDIDAVWSRLKRDIRQSVEIGWIDDPGTADWLVTKVDWAQVRFRSGDRLGAVRPLDEILIFLDDYDRHGISSEAFTIVYNNVTWLRDNLDGTSGHPRKPDAAK